MVKNVSFRANVSLPGCPNTSLSNPLVVETMEDANGPLPVVYRSFSGIQSVPEVLRWYSSCHVLELVQSNAEPRSVQHVVFAFLHNVGERRYVTPPEVAGRTLTCCGGVPTWTKKVPHFPS